MATGRHNQLTKQTGEYLVAAELCRRGLIATTFTGNVPDFDILATSEAQETVPIQVKTTPSTSWQFSDVRRYLKIDFDGKRQILRGKVKLVNPNLICIFVRLREQIQDEFYICTENDLREVIYRNYRTEIILKRKGIRKKNPESYHSAIEPKQLEQFLNNWKLLEQSLDKRQRK